jgi:hypothetical protein
MHVSVFDPQVRLKRACGTALWCAWRPRCPPRGAPLAAQRAAPTAARRTRVVTDSATDAPRSRRAPQLPRLGNFPSVAGVRGCLRRVAAPSDVRATAAVALGSPGAQGRVRARRSTHRAPRSCSWTRPPGAPRRHAAGATLGATGAGMLRAAAVLGQRRARTPGAALKRRRCCGPGEHGLHNSRGWRDLDMRQHNLRRWAGVTARGRSSAKR